MEKPDSTEATLAERVRTSHLFLVEIEDGHRCNGPYPCFRCEIADALEDKDRHARELGFKCLQQHREIERLRE